jgi:4-hydroxy-3-methylbut-2-enyl diphosphate reductase
MQLKGHQMSEQNISSPEGLGIVLASDMGFCFGVRRAVAIMEDAAQKQGPIDSLGAIVHNHIVVEDLERQGIHHATNIEALERQTVAITAHGVGPNVWDELAKRGYNVVDTTCPIVTRAQKAARQLSEAGFTVVVFGKADHPEVRGVLGYVGERGIATTDWRDVVDAGPFPRRLGVIAQTTQNLTHFQEFVKQLIEAAAENLWELRVVNTLCDATSSQQAAARLLAQEVDTAIVVGGKQSANTRHLAEVCEEEGIPTHHIESAAELDGSWFRRGLKVGVTAGASTPDASIYEVIAWLEQWQPE